MTKAFHFLEIGTLDLVCGSLAHFWRGAPVVFSREEVDRALGHIDLVNSVASIKPTKIEVEVSVEDSYGNVLVEVMSIRYELSLPYA